MVLLYVDSSPKVSPAMYDYAEVSIRRADLGEVDTVRSILQEAYGGVRKRLPKDPVGPQDGLDKISRSIQMGNIYVAIIGDSIVGTMRVQLQGQVGTISRIGVLERFRNRRVGTFLVEYAENLLTHMGAKTVQLEVVSAMDTQTKFYEGIGYKTVEHREGSGTDVLMMRKDLFESEQEEDEDDV
jgi:ribosomal protein S18 acetylase RimI-like enzyme